MPDVKPISFDAIIKCTPTGGNGQIGNGDAVLVYAESISIDTTQFYSKDSFSKKREGVVILDISGQMTSFPFNGDRTVIVSNKYLNKVAYLGTNPGKLGMSLSVIESDQAARDALNNLETWTKKLANVPFLTAIHPAVGPGLGLISSVLKMIKTSVDDDCEAQAFCVFDDALKNEQKITLAFSRTSATPPLLTVVLKVVGLGTLGKDVGRFSVRIKKPVLTLNTKQPVSVEEIEPSSGMVISTSSTVEGWWDKNKISIFNVDAASGKSKYSYTNVSGNIRPAAKQGIIAWDKNALFTVKGGDVPAGKLLPLSLAFSLHPQKLNTDGILDLLKQGSALASIMMPEVTNATQVLTKQAPNVLNFLSEITSDSLSLYSFNGLVVLASAAPPANVPVGKGALWAQQTTGANTWTAEVNEPITWRDEVIGNFSFDVEVVAV